MNLVGELPNLSSFELGGTIRAGSRPSSEGNHTNKVLAHLLKYGRLTKLKLGKDLSLSNSDVKEISNLVHKTHPGNCNLTSLSIKGHYDALDFFLENTATSLRALEIDVPLTNLTELRLHLMEDQVLYLNDLAPFTGLSRLKVLQITTYWPEDIPNSDWTDENFGTWISYFPELRELELVLGGVCRGAPAIAAIGRSCPKLEQCTLGWAQDLSTWTSLVDQGPVLFPNLRKLGVHSVDTQFIQSCQALRLDPEWEDEMTEEGLKQLKTILKLASRLECISFADLEHSIDPSALQLGLDSLEIEHEDDLVWYLDKNISPKIEEDDIGRPREDRSAGMLGEIRI
ncbi:hypothetical protein QM012_003668 [Aureobasidium pullulans]|uniref:Uncharacterized protein n=1 Tax=Aureobasidium pullulans TaxID=5580 RepID=A0ABR0T7K2_AURPU